MSTLPHEELISRIDESAKVFDVLILKSTLTLPYTSVFLELGCGYWDDGAETRLRDRMKGEQPDVRAGSFFSELVTG